MSLEGDVESGDKTQKDDIGDDKHHYPSVEHLVVNVIKNIRRELAHLVHHEGPECYLH